SVVRLILQFLKENNLSNSFSVLQEESQVSLNTVDDPEMFKSNIIEGNWDKVFEELNSVQMPSKNLVDLFEHVFYELMEIGEVGTARSVLRQTDPMIVLREIDPDRYLKLEYMLAKHTFDPSQAYQGTTKEKRRRDIAQKLTSQMEVVEPSRLLTLLGQAIKFNKENGILSKETSALDIFKGENATSGSDEERIPSVNYANIKFAPGSFAESGCFSPNGSFFVTGSADGFIEVWNIQTGQLRTDLEYQAKENFMIMENHVTALRFAKDNVTLASGSNQGELSIWNVQTGKLYKTSRPHLKGIT
ncbi:WD40 repeat-like protein, partial [Rozella allomycis CSF55]